MALKRIVDDINSIEENVRSLYVEKNGKYHLDIDGDEDVSALKRAKDREAEEKRQAKEQLRETQAKLDEALAKLSENSEVTARKKGDIETLEKSWETKLNNEVAKRDAVIQNLHSEIDNYLVGATASKIAAEISTSPSIMERFIKERMKVEYDGDKPSLRILDKEGKISALSLDDLKKEFVDDAAFAAIITGSRASGGGASGTGGGAPNKKPAEMNDKERIELYKSNPEQFRQLFGSK